MLNTYITEVQDLLHDEFAQLWSVATLTNYINEARVRVAQDTKSCRTLLVCNALNGLSSNYSTLTLNQGQEFYTLSTYLPSPYNTSLIEVLGITCVVNNERYRLKYWPYVQLDTFLRGWVNYQDWPIVFSRISNTYIVVEPVPNQTYPSEWDIAYAPQPLASDGDPEPIPVPFQELVQYYAAYKAKLKIQAQGEAKYFLDLYDEIKRRNLKAWMSRVIPNPYATQPR